MNNKAFSLVELSITLIIIALLSGSVIAGVNLYNQSRLQNVIKEIDIINNAYLNFKDKYSAIPGDMSNIPANWTSSVAGNGDGVINNGSEIQNTWNHLYLAGMINQVIASNNAFYKSIYSSGLYTISSNVTNAQATSLNASRATFGRYGNGFNLGTKYSIIYSTGALFTTKEAYYIDIKIDDGIANYGILYGTDGNPYPGTAACSAQDSSNPSSSLNYIMSTNNAACQLRYWGNPNWSL